MTKFKQKALFLPLLAMTLVLMLGNGCATAQNTGQSSSVFGSSSGGGLKLEAEPEGDAGQVIEFEKTTYDLGTFKQGESVDLEIPFKSTGSEALEVIDVKPSCSCSSLKWTDSPIPSGQSGTLKASIDTSEMDAGEKTKYFMFRYEGDPGVERIKVTFVLE